jgi:hypothetical protein
VTRNFAALKREDKGREMRRMRLRGRERERESDQVEKIREKEKNLFHLFLISFFILRELSKAFQLWVMTLKGVKVAR